MSELEALVVAPGVVITAQELEVTAITGSGPGGQHVNRSATRIELRWNVQRSRALREDQRARLLTKLATRLDAEGTIRIVAGEYRSQQQNRRAALERLAHLVARALIVAPPRRATRPTRASVERRLDSKRQRSDTKQQRRRQSDD
ncbi:MAG: alternative ribosome rescue aminoacyl-tRNA hydrolase ArfB [Gemmatimonadaceae bacterium]